jgi:hypothetical protein
VKRTWIQKLEESLHDCERQLVAVELAIVAHTYPPQGVEQKRSWERLCSRRISLISRRLNILLRMDAATATNEGVDDGSAQAHRSDLIRRAGPSRTAREVHMGGQVRAGTDP